MEMDVKDAPTLSALLAALEEATPLPDRDAFNKVADVVTSRRGKGGVQIHTTSCPHMNDGERDPLLAPGLAAEWPAVCPACPGPLRGLYALGLAFDAARAVVDYQVKERLVGPYAPPVDRLTIEDAAGVGRWVRRTTSTGQYASAGSAKDRTLIREMMSAKDRDDCGVVKRAVYDTIRVCYFRQDEVDPADWVVSLAEFVAVNEAVQRGSGEARWDDPAWVTDLAEEVHRIAEGQRAETYGEARQTIDAARERHGWVVVTAGSHGFPLGHYPLGPMVLATRGNRGLNEVAAVPALVAAHLHWKTLEPSVQPLMSEPMSRDTAEEIAHIARLVPPPDRNAAVVAALT